MDIHTTLLSWLAILILALANGALREFLFIPRFGRRTGLVASGFLLIACVLVAAWVASPHLGAATHAARLGIGTLWLAMTLAFEFGFGRLVQH